MKKLLVILAFLFTSKFLHAQLYPLYFTFDTIEPVYIDTNLANNIWQIGRPQKTIFDSSFSFPNAIVTDTINFYPSNNISEFIVKTPTYWPGMGGGVEMYFRHKYDTDSLLDGGTVLVSTDGINYVNLLNSPDLIFPFNYYSVYDSIASLNDIGFSGNLNQWWIVDCMWNYPSADTLWIKFKFASDNIQTNREGWLIDDLTFSYNLGIGINEMNSSSYFISPNPFHERTIIRLRNSLDFPSTLTIYDLQGKIIQSLEVQTNTINLNLHGLKSGVYIFCLNNSQGNKIYGKLLSE
jgi:hypothetical protein